MYKQNDKPKNQKLVFKYQHGSFTSSNKIFEIDIDLACQKTGLNRSYIIPMADYMVRNMIVINKNDELVLDDSNITISIEKSSIQIQSIIRGYMVRVRFTKHAHLEALLL